MLGKAISKKMVALVAAFTLAGCGGTGGPSSTTTMAPVMAAAQGYVIGAAVVQNDHVRAGDSFFNNSYAGVLAFDLAGLGDVESATLTFHRIDTFGNPWALGPLQVDHIDGGGLLDAGDGVVAALTEAIHSLGNQPAWSVDVTNQVKIDQLAGRTTTTYRLRMNLPTDADNALDYARIGTSLNADPNLRPFLVVTHVP